MKRIVVKSGVAQLPLFVRENYSYYEAYLRGDEKLADLLKTKMKLLSIHMPSQVDTANGKKQLDFCADNEIGEASLKKLSEIVDFAEENNVFYIVIHLGFFNSLQENRFRKLEKAAKKFNQFAARKVTLCLENVPCWTNIYALKMSRSFRQKNIFCFLRNIVRTLVQCLMLIILRLTRFSIIFMKILEKSILLLSTKNCIGKRWNK